MITTTIASVFKYILARVLEWHTQNKCTGKNKDVLTKPKFKLKYAVGLFLGAALENKIALGTSNLELIAGEESTKQIIGYLKERNKGYTVFEGHGSVDRMNMVFIVIPRKEVKKTLKEIRSLCDNKVFVVTSEVSKYAGGYGMVK